MSVRIFKNFLILFYFILGLIYIFIIPPFQSPDEPNHYFRAVSIFHTDGDVHTYNQRLGVNISQSFIDFTRYTVLLKDKKISYQVDLIEDLFNSGHNKSSVFVDIPNTALYNSILYFPQAIGIYFFKSSNLFLSYLSGKFITFLFYFLFVFYLIKHLKINIIIPIILVLSLPVNLMIATSYNADTVNNLACITVLTIFLRNSRNHRTLHILLLFGASSILAFGKLSSIPIVLLAIIYFFRSYSRKTFVGLSILLSILTISAAFYTYLNSRSLYIPYHEYNPLFVSGQPLLANVYPDLQIHYVLKDPIHFVGIVFKSLINEWEFIYKSSIGKMGWLEWEINKYSMFGFFSLLAFWSFFGKYTNNRQISKTAFQNFYSLILVSIALTFAFMLIMYITWTPLGLGRVNNLQGRYFFPAYLCFFLALGNLKFYRPSRKILFLNIIVLILLHSVSLYEIYARYYKISPQ